MTGPEAPKGLPTQTNEIHQPQMGGSRVCMPFRMSHRACPGENVAVIGCLKAGHRSCSSVSFLGCLGPGHMRGQMAILPAICLCACVAFVVWVLMCVLPPYCPLKKLWSIVFSAAVRTNDPASARACVRSRVHVVEFRNVLRELRNSGGEC